MAFEMSKKDMPVSRFIDLKEMTKGDESPFFVRIVLAEENSIGSGTLAGTSVKKRYTPQACNELVSEMAPKKDWIPKLYPGHQKPDDTGYEFREPWGNVIGTAKEGKAAVAYAYILPKAAMKEAGDVREGIQRLAIRAVSLEAKVRTLYNKAENILDVVGVLECKGIAFANEEDAGIKEARIVDIINEMKNSEGGQEPVDELKKLLESLDLEMVTKFRPDLLEKIEKGIKDKIEDEQFIEEMRKEVETFKGQAEEMKKDSEAKDQKVKELEAQIAEMKKADELKAHKEKIMKGIPEGFSDEIMEMLHEDITGNTVAEMDASRDKALARLEKLGIKPGEKAKTTTTTTEVKEMITGVVNSIEMQAPTLTPQDAILLRFKIDPKGELTKKYNQFGHAVEMISANNEMARFYADNGARDVASILSMDLLEMQTRSDFPDLFETAFNTLLIDAYLMEEQQTFYQEIFTPFTMTKATVRFPSLKGFQVGRIIEGEEPPMTSLKPGPQTIVTAEDYGILLKLSYQLMRDNEIDVMRYNIMETGRAHARKKQEVAMHLLAASFGQQTGPVVNSVQAIRNAKIIGEEIYDVDTGKKQPVMYDTLIMSPGRVEQLLPATSTMFFQGVATDPNTGDVKGVAGLKVYRTTYIPDDFCLLVKAKDRMIHAQREALSIANKEDFKTRAEDVRSWETYTFAVLYGDNVLRVDFA